MDFDPLSGDASAIAARLRAGDVTARAVTDACLARIAARDQNVRAWAYLDPAAARAQADARDAVAVRGPLHGLPVGIKDVLLTRDMPTEYNCDLYAGHAPAIDAACTAMLRQAGAVILGKTATVELASIGRPPATRNPHAPDHTPGGSSSGSAAAVTDDQVPLAIGTQTGGSIIRPAAFCGAWALKPSWGIVSTEGAKPFAPSLDTIGWFGRSADDLALLLNVFDPQPAPPPVPSLADAHIGVWRTAGWHQAETATRTIIDAALARLRAIGARVTELDMPPSFADLAAVQRTVMFAEGQRAFQADYRTDARRLHPRIAEMVRTGGGDRAALRAAYDAAALARIRFDAIAGGCDAVLVPSTIGTAPHGLGATGDLLFNGIFTLLHVPCVHMPLARAADGLPIGLTLTGARYDDRRIVAMARNIAKLF